MKYLLDTNTCVYLLNGNEILKRKVKEIGVYSLSISNCILAELYFGAYNSKRFEENLGRIDLFKKIFPFYLIVMNRLDSLERLKRI